MSAWTICLPFVATQRLSSDLSDRMIACENACCRSTFKPQVTIGTSCLRLAFIMERCDERFVMADVDVENWGAN